MIELTIELSDAGAAQTVQRIRNGLTKRSGLHARMAQTGGQFTRDYVTKLDRHATAQRLGAAPTQHLARVSKGIGQVSSEAGGAIRIPRASRLRAAFGSYVLKPKGGKKYLTIPASARTYGKRAGEIQEKLSFALLGRHKALLFADGTVAYWLKETVTIPGDATLLPLVRLPKVLQGAAIQYLGELQKGGAA